MEISGDRVLVGRLADDDMGAGAVSVFDTVDTSIQLSITPTQPSTGDPIVIETSCGLPGGLFLFNVNSIDGVPQFVRVLTELYDDDGFYRLSTTTPPAVSGLTIGFDVIGQAADGGVSISDTVLIDFL